MQGKLCHPENECELPPEFVFLAFDGGNIVQEHGKKKVSEIDIRDIFLSLINTTVFHLGKVTLISGITTLTKL